MIRLLYVFDFDTATITSSSEASDLPDDNVVDRRVSKKWRTTDDISEWIEFDFGAPHAPPTEVSLFGYNLTTGSTVKLYYGNISPPSYLAGTFSYNSENHIMFITTSDLLLENPRYWRITFEDPSNPDGYIEVGRICGGVYFQPTQNFRCGSERFHIDPSEKFRSDGQDMYSRKKDKYWIYRIVMELLEAADKNNFRTLFDTIGITEPIVVTLDPDNEPNISTIYALLVEPYKEKFRAPVPVYDLPWEFKEII